LSHAPELLAQAGFDLCQLTFEIGQRGLVGFELGFGLLPNSFLLLEAGQDGVFGLQLFFQLGDTGLGAGDGGNELALGS
jgi:hypothetical protein